MNPVGISKIKIERENTEKNEKYFLRGTSMYCFQEKYYKRKIKR